MKILLSQEAFQPLVEIQRYEDEMQQQGKFGASSFFIGSMRDNNECKNVLSMELEHYPGMTEKHLKDIAAQANQTWSLLGTLIIHRVGHIEVGEPIVLVATWSAHRAAAFDACRHIMEDLKSKAPFWKKETTTEGQRWVEQNTPG